VYAANDLLPVIRVLSHWTQERSERIAQSATDAAEDGCRYPLVERQVTNRSQSACLDGLARYRWANRKEQPQSGQTEERPRKLREDKHRYRCGRDPSEGVGERASHGGSGIGKGRR